MFRRYDYPAWWHHELEAFFTLLVFCEENPPVTCGFLSQRASDVELWYFLSYQPRITVEEMVALLVILAAPAAHVASGTTSTILIPGHPIIRRCKKNLTYRTCRHNYNHISFSVHFEYYGSFFPVEYETLWTLRKSTNDILNLWLITSNKFKLYYNAATASNQLGHDVIIAEAKKSNSRLAWRYL